MWPDDGHGRSRARRAVRSGYPCEAPPQTPTAPHAVTADHNGRSRDLGVLALALLGPIWGYGWVATKIALGYSDALTFAALRVPFSAACLFLVMLVLRRSLRPPPLGWTAIIALFQTTLFIGLVITALHDAGAGKVSVLTYTMPFWLLLLAWAFLGERLRGPQWAAVALALFGLVLVVRPWQLGSATAGILALLGGVSWAVAALLVKLMQRHHTVDVLSLTTWQMTLGSIPLVVAALVTYSGAPQWTFSFWWGLIYTIVVANSLAWFLWLYALHTLPAGIAGLGTLGIPVVGVAGAWLQLGEVPTLAEGAGMALIIVALAVLAAHGILSARRGSPMGGGEPDLRPVTD
jgi:drug/metabolite transporter (DMT)-like permease